MTEVSLSRDEFYWTIHGQTDSRSVQFAVFIIITANVKFRFVTFSQTGDHQHRRQMDQSRIVQ